MSTPPVLDAAASGFYAIAPSPFAADGRLLLEAVGPMVEAYAQAGASGITVLGVMGEAPKLTEAESLALVREVLRHAGRMPVVVGVSAPGLAPMAALAGAAMSAGAAGVMIAPVAGLRGDDAVLGYLRQAVQAVGADVPYVLQDYPQANGIAISPGMVARLAADTNLAMVKAEDWPGLDKLSALRALIAERRMRRVSLFCGNGAQFLPHELARGADGVMTGYAFPEMLVQVSALVKAGRVEEAHDLFDAHLPLIRYEAQPGLGLVVRKYVLTRRGILPSAALRAPAPALTAATRAEVDLLLDRLQRRLSALGAQPFRLAA
jgi:4-hydroxy-tetrahydrodipicolinate synthase